MSNLTKQEYEELKNQDEAETGSKRSADWHKIMFVLKQLPINPVPTDCMDLPSAATELEKVFKERMQRASLLIAELESLLSNALCPNECIDGVFVEHNPPNGSYHVTCPWCQDREKILNKTTQEK